MRENILPLKKQHFGKPMRAIKTPLIIGTCALLLTSCANKPRYVSHEKERNEPQPRRLEAPYEQIREPAQDEKKNQETLPASEGKTPDILEQDLFVPGQDKFLYGIVIEGREGLVLSPYAPDKGLIDVRDFPPGSQVRDPYTGNVMRVPLPLRIKKQETQTLSEPAFQTPSPTTNPETPTPPTPPTLE